jgi:hypothetical protein
LALGAKSAAVHVDQSRLAKIDSAQLRPTQLAANLIPNQRREPIHEPPPTQGHQPNFALPVNANLDMKDITNVLHRIGAEIDARTKSRIRI